MYVFLKNPSLCFQLCSWVVTERTCCLCLRSANTDLVVGPQLMSGSVTIWHYRVSWLPNIARLPSKHCQVSVNLTCCGRASFNKVVLSATPGPSNAQQKTTTSQEICEATEGCAYICHLVSTHWNVCVLQATGNLQFWTSRTGFCAWQVSSIN